MILRTANEPAHITTIYILDQCNFCYKTNMGAMIGLVWLVVFYVPSTERSFRDGTPNLLSLAKDVKLGFYDSAWTVQQ